MAVGRLQQHWDLAVLVLPTVAVQVLVQGAVRAAGGHRGVVESRGVVGVRLFWAVVCVRCLQLTHAVPRGLAEGALTRVAGLAPSCCFGREQGAGGMTAVVGQMFQGSPVSLVAFPPHWAAGPALQAHRSMGAIYPVGEVDSVSADQMGQSYRS